MDEQMESWRFWSIEESDWKAGWRRTLEDAVEAAEWIPFDKPSAITIVVKKRSDNAVHDYKVDP